MYFTLKEFGPSTRHGGAARFLGRFPRDDLIYFVAYGGSQRLQVAKHQRSRQIHQRVFGDALGKRQRVPSRKEGKAHHCWRDYTLSVNNKDGTYTDIDRKKA